MYEGVVHMSSQRTLVRLYVKFFIGTIVVWVAMLLATAALLFGTASGPPELLLVLCGGAIASLLWGVAWFVALSHERSAAAASTGAPTGAVAPVPPEVLRRAPYLYLAGTLLIWIGLLVATVIVMRDDPHFIAEMVLILGAGVIWSIIVVPAILALGSEPHMPMPHTATS